MRTNTSAKRNLNAVESIFFSYVRGNRDRFASPLVDVVAREAAHAEGFTLNAIGNTRYTYLMAKKAAELLENLPTYPESRLMSAPRNDGLPETRRELWEILIRGMLHASEQECLEFGNALLRPVQLSEKERDTLRECLKNRFDRISQYDAKQLCLVLRSCDMPYNPVVFRGMMLAVVRYASETDLRDFVRPNHA